MVNLNEARLKRESVESESFVLRRDGLLDKLDTLVVEAEKNPQLRAFLSRETGLLQGDLKAPPHIAIMQGHELVDYEPASDTGHFRFYPKGALMKDLLADLAEVVAIKRMGATKIETPVLYRNEGAVKEQAASFHEADYHLEEEGRELILRFAGDFGLFNMVRDARVGEKQLPLRVYEISPSFRREKRGSCTGLKRLRAFTMPDVHCFCGGLEQGMEEFARLHKFYDQFLKDAGLPFALGFRTTKDFFGSNKDYIRDRLKESDQDALVDVLDSMKHYWVLKNEFQFIDSSRDNVQLSTVQLDISDAARYNLGYTASDGSKKPYVIVHSSMGSIERIMGAILEERAKEIERGEKPAFPYWLSPTQLRLLPISEKHVQFAENLANQIDGVRVDIDDRSSSLSKRVRAAEKEWIPAYAVIGDKEEVTREYLFKLRGKDFEGRGEIRTNAEGIRQALQEAQGNLPHRNSYLDRNVSRQLRFGSSY